MSSFRNVDNYDLKKVILHGVPSHIKEVPSIFLGIQEFINDYRTTLMAEIAKHFVLHLAPPDKNNYLSADLNKDYLLEYMDEQPEHYEVLKQLPFEALETILYNPEYLTEYNAIFKYLDDGVNVFYRLTPDRALKSVKGSLDTCYALVKGAHPDFPTGVYKKPEHVSSSTVFVFPSTPVTYNSYAV